MHGASSAARPVQNHLILRMRSAIAIPDYAKSDLDVVLRSQQKEAGDQPRRASTQGEAV
jgi:hypothetical protein